MSSSPLTHGLLALVLTLIAGTVMGEPSQLSGTVRHADGRPFSGARAILEPLPATHLAGQRLLGEAGAEPSTDAPIAESVADGTGSFELEVRAAGFFRLRVEAPGFVAMERSPLPVVEPRRLPPVVLLPDEGTELTVETPASRPAFCLWTRPARTIARDDPWLRVAVDGWRPAPRPACREEGGVVRLSRAVGERLDIAIFSRGERAVLEPQRLVKVQLRAHARLRLPKGGGPVVTVRDAHGGSVAEVVVLAGRDLWPVGQTDAAGRLALAEPTTTSLELVLLAPDGFRQAVSLVPGVVDATWILASPGATRGSVTGEDGHPIAGALVWPIQDPGTATTTDPAGGFVLPPMGAETGIQAEAPGFLPRMVEGVSPSVLLRLAAAGSVAGRVVDSHGRPLSGVSVTAWPLDQIPRVFSLDAALDRVPSAADGRFELSRLVPGAIHVVRAERAGWVTAERALGGLKAGLPRTGVDLVLARSRAATGRVITLEQHGGQEVERPVAAAEILIRTTRDPGDILGRRPGSELKLTTDADGVFTAVELPGLTVDVAARASGLAPMFLYGLEIDPGDDPPPGEALDPVELGTLVLVPAAAIHGVVTDVEGRAIPGAGIWLSRKPDEDPGLTLASLGNSPPLAEAAGDGSFTVGDLPPGERFHLFVHAPGFLPVAVEAVEVPSPEPIAVVLKPGARVSGRVIDVAGAPVKDARVSLGGWEQPDGRLLSPRLGPESRKDTRTGDDGTFAFDSLPFGRYRLDVTAADFVDPPPYGLTFAAGDEGTGAAEGVEIVLARGALIEGWITREHDGAPVAGAMVVGGEKWDRSGEDGSYRLGGLAAGKVTVEVRHDKYNTVSETLVLAEHGAELLDMVLPVGRWVRGRVVDEHGSGVADVHVALEGGAPRDRHRYRTLSGGGGSFAFDEVAKGIYKLRAKRSGYAVVEVEEAVLGDVAVDDLEVFLPRGAKVSGELLGLDFDALALAQVEAEHPNGRLQDGTVDALGRYAVTDLEPGDWLIRAHTPRGHQEATVRVAIPVAGAVERDVEFGTGLTLSGVVLLGGEPLAGALVSVHGRDVAVEREARSDHQGRFRVTGLPAANYRASAIHHYERMLVNRHVRLDSDAEIELVIESVRLAGRVLDASNGAPVSDVMVFVRQLVGTERRPISMINLYTVGDGRFDFTRLNAGTYEFIARREGYVEHHEELELRAGSNPPVLRVELEPASGLQLTVSTASGTAPSWVQARYRGASGRWIETPYRPDGEGRGRLPSLPSGRHHLLLTAPGSAPVELEVDVPGAPLPVVFPPAGRLHLRVPALVETDTIASAVLLDTAGRPLRGSDGTTSWQLPAGRGVIEGVPAGSWSVLVEAAGGRWEGAVTTPGRGETAVELP